MDQTITCATCKTPFVFTEGEQQYFAERGYYPPRHCRPCRAQRKAESADSRRANGQQ